MSKYFSYLLRIWLEGDPKQRCWRAALEDPHTREIRMFESVESLFEYIKRISYYSADEDHSALDG